jgi:Cu/Ag efflux protein CusF
MKAKTMLSAAALVLSTIAAPVIFSAEDGHDDHQGAMDHGPAHKLHGVVNSVNAEAGRVNITHDPVESLKWPKMKMNFKAHDAALLKDLKAGMTVDFEITKMGNEYHVTKITPAN